MWDTGQFSVYRSTTPIWSMNKLEEYWSRISENKGRGRIVESKEYIQSQINLGSNLGSATFQLQDLEQVTLKILKIWGNNSWESQTAFWIQCFYVRQWIYKNIERNASKGHYLQQKKICNPLLLLSWIYKNHTETCTKKSAK